MKDKLFDFIGKYPFGVILLTLLITLAAGAGVKNIVFKADYRVFFGEDNPQLVAYDKMQNVYNKSDNVSFIVVPKDGNVFSKKHLAAIKTLTKQSWQIPYSTLSLIHI